GGGGGGEAPPPSRVGRRNPDRPPTPAPSSQPQPPGLRPLRRPYPPLFQPPRGQRMSHSAAFHVSRLLGNALLSTATFCIFLLGWEAIVRGFGISKIVLPAPSAIALAFWESAREGELHWHLAVTVYEVLAGFLVGSIGGLVLGFIVALSPLMERIFYPYVVAFQTVPKVAIAPIIVIWFGYGVASKVVITATIAFFPLLANTIMGLRAAPQDQIEML